MDLTGLTDEEIWAKGLNLEYVIDAYRNLNLGDHFFRSFFEKLIGVDYVRRMIEEGKSRRRNQDHVARRCGEVQGATPSLSVV